MSPVGLTTGDVYFWDRQASTDHIFRLLSGYFSGIPSLGRACISVMTDMQEN
jgi:hypothetical protein